MTKSEIENLIKWLDERIPKRAMNERYHDGEKFVEKGVEIYCKVNDLCDILRVYPVEGEKICGPDYKAEYERCMAELEKSRAHVESVQFDLRNLSREHDHYVGAVAIIETITGRKFEPEYR